MPSGRSLAITQGALLLLVGLFAASSGGYAACRVFLGDRFGVIEAIVVGLLWGSLVFLIDRSVAMCVDVNSLCRKAISVAIRLRWRRS